MISGAVNIAQDRETWRGLCHYISAPTDRYTRTTSNQQELTLVSVHGKWMNEWIFNENNKGKRQKKNFEFLKNSIF